MSTRSKTAVVLASAGVLIAGWQIGTANGQTVEAGVDPTTTTETTSPSGPSTDTSTDTGSSGSSSSGSSTSGGSTSGSSAGGVSGTFTGETASSQYGDVTVTVTLESGTITEVDADASVYDRHSQRYVQTAIPILREEVLAANSADVDTVSGATFTSQSYLSSLQSALDKAGR